MRNINKNKLTSTVIFLIMLLIAVSSVGGIQNMRNLSVVLQTMLIYVLLLKLSKWAIKEIQSYMKFASEN